MPSINGGGTMATAYSYIRFSSDRQQFGHSLQRQTELATAYCTANNLTLDTSLNLKDLGISAFKGDNAATGALSVFLNCVESGKIEPGSILILESLDRLTRQHIKKALALFLNILSAGIAIVTLFDNKMYTDESTNEVSDIIYALIILSRGHEESATKSTRVKAAYNNRLKKAVDNKTPVTKICPAWMQNVDGKFELLPTETAIIKDIISKYLGGMGYHNITKYLNQSYPPLKVHAKQPKLWYISYVKNTLRNPALVGRWKEIDGYYPRIIDDETFAKLQTIRAGKQSSGGRKSAIINIFSHITKCKKCGGSCVRLNKAAHGKPYIYMACNNGRSGKNDCGTKMWKLDELEHKLLTAITEINIKSVLGVDDNTAAAAIEASIIKDEYDIDEIAKKLSRLRNAREDEDDADEIELIKTRIAELRTTEKSLQQDVKVLKAKLDVENTKYQSAITAQANIKSLMDRLDDNDIRTKLGMEIKKVVDKIELNFVDKRYRVYYKNADLKLGVHNYIVDVPADGGKPQLRKVK